MEYCLHCNSELRGPQDYPGFCCLEHRAAYFRGSVRPRPARVAYRVGSFISLGPDAEFATPPEPAQWQVNSHAESRIFWPVPPRKGSRIPIATFDQRWATEGVRPPRSAKLIAPPPQPSRIKPRVVQLEPPGWKSDPRLAGSAFVHFPFVEAVSASEPMPADAPLQWRLGWVRRVYDPTLSTATGVREIWDLQGSKPWSLGILSISEIRPPAPKIRGDVGGRRLFQPVPNDARVLPLTSDLRILGIPMAPAWSLAPTPSEAGALWEPHSAGTAYLPVTPRRKAPPFRSLGPDQDSGSRSRYRVPPMAALPLHPALWEARALTGAAADSAALHAPFSTAVNARSPWESVSKRLLSDLSFARIGGPGSSGVSPLPVSPESSSSTTELLPIRYARALRVPTAEAQSPVRSLSTLPAGAGFEGYRLRAATYLATGFGVVEFQRSARMPEVRWQPRVHELPFKSTLAVEALKRGTASQPPQPWRPAEPTPTDVNPPIRTVILRRKASPPLSGFASVPVPRFRAPQSSVNDGALHPASFQLPGKWRLALNKLSGETLQGKTERTTTFGANPGRSVLVGEPSPLSHRWNRKGQIWDRSRWIEHHQVRVSDLPFEDVPPFAVIRDPASMPLDAG